MSEHENAIDYGDGFLRRTGTAVSETFIRDTKGSTSKDFGDSSSTQRLDRRRAKAMNKIRVFVVRDPDYSAKSLIFA